MTRESRRLSRVELVAAMQGAVRERAAILDLASIRTITQAEEARFQALEVEIALLEKQLPLR